MFGKQHDVSECMDNCIFQIETALLKFGGVNEEGDKTSLVKRCALLFTLAIMAMLTMPDCSSARLNSA